MVHESGREVLAIVQKDFPLLRKKGFPVKSTNELSGAILLFDLGKEDSIKVCEDYLFEI